MILVEDSAKRWSLNNGIYFDIPIILLRMSFVQVSCTIHASDLTLGQEYLLTLHIVMIYKVIHEKL